jgi:hypothetical protein
VHKGKGELSKSGHGGKDGWQSKPSGSCQPEEPSKVASVPRKERRMATWNVTGARNRGVELKGAVKAYKIGMLCLSETCLKRERVSYPRLYLDECSRRERLRKRRRSRFPCQRG